MAGNHAADVAFSKNLPGDQTQKVSLPDIPQDLQPINCLSVCYFP